MKIMASGPITSWQIEGERMETKTDFIFGAPKSLQMVTAAMDLKDTCSLKKSYDKPIQHIKKQRQYFADKGPSSQSYGFSSSHVWMWELDYKESWALKNWCFWTVVLEKTLESPLDCKEIQSVHPKGNQSWIFIGRTDAEAETLILWPPDVKNWLIGKDPDAEKDWRQEKGTTEDEMLRWHHWLDGHEFEQVLGVGDGQGSLVCCSPWGCKELDMTEWLNWTELNSPGCWLQASVPLHRDRSTGLCECPHNMAAGYQTGWSCRESKEETTVPCVTSSRESYTITSATVHSLDASDWLYPTLKGK